MKNMILMLIKTIDRFLAYCIVSRKDNQTEIYWELKDKYLNSSSFFKRKILLNKLSKIQRDANAFIPPQNNIKRFVTPHGFNGIFISTKAKIGENCVIFHQVTIGSNTLSDSKNSGFPIVGDNVIIGAGAKIIGKVTVGNNVRIGANCIVVDNVPDNCTVVLSKPRIIMHKDRINNSFISAGNYMRFESVTNNNEN